MKTLVIVTHPNINDSVINKKWVEELLKFPERYTVHQLYEVYPDEKIDILTEQRLVEQYEKIVFQFPYYWFNCPSLLKKWLDEVLTHGWAYGSKSGYQMKNKKIALAISLGVERDELCESGLYKYTLQELTRPFELSFEYIKADYQKPFAFYGMEHNTTQHHIATGVKSYMAFLSEF
ncbi:NAD(P)H-dependent oxidoreductase [Mucilaginibacter roseus]|uniref:NAD(P)H-dependent oxidoreductase n=1 Tax=Mucilaginibacter roseus TaxID=1528868 RepID=A0ABS8U248_9SPHI|nr:NAD(P)H-dependent oxidoreductase [Mucilaginibacter roseus]MCD8739839.1 NAD(P)H-dependent oxidoreductase [Mucilaginibacter roseus]